MATQSQQKTTTLLERNDSEGSDIAPIITFSLSNGEKPPVLHTTSAEAYQHRNEPAVASATPQSPHHTTEFNTTANSITPTASASVNYTANATSASSAADFTPITPQSSSFSPSSPPSPRTLLATTIITDAVNRDMQSEDASSLVRAPPQLLTISPSPRARTLQQQQHQQQQQHTQPPLSPSHLPSPSALLSPASLAPPSPSWSLSSEALTQASTAVTWMSDARETSRFSGWPGRSGNHNSGNSDRYGNSGEFDPVSMSRLTYSGMGGGVDEEEETETDDALDSEFTVRRGEAPSLLPGGGDGGESSTNGSGSGDVGADGCMGVGVGMEMEEEARIVVKGGEDRPELTSGNTGVIPDGSNAIVGTGPAAGVASATPDHGAGTAAVGGAGDGSGSGVAGVAGASGDAVGMDTRSTTGVTTGGTSPADNSSQLPSTVAGQALQTTTSSSPDAAATSAAASVPADVVSAVSVLLAAAPPQRRGSTSRTDKTVLHPEISNAPEKTFSESQEKPGDGSSYAVADAVTATALSDAAASRAQVDGAAAAQAAIAATPATDTATATATTTNGSGNGSGSGSGAASGSGEAVAAGPDASVAVTPTTVMHAAAAPAALSVRSRDTHTTQPHLIRAPSAASAALPVAVAGHPLDSARSLALPPASHARSHSLSPHAPSAASPRPAPAPAPSPSHALSHSLSSARRASLPSASSDQLLGQYIHARESLTPRGVPVGAGVGAGAVYEQMRAVAGGTDLRTPRRGVVEGGQTLGIASALGASTGAGAGAVGRERLVEGLVASFHAPEAAETRHASARFLSLDDKEAEMEVEALLATNLHALSTGELRVLAERAVAALQGKHAEVGRQQEQLREYDTVMSQRAREEEEERVEREKQVAAVTAAQQQAARAERRQRELEARVRTLVEEKGEKEEAVGLLMREKEAVERRVAELEQEKQVFGKNLGDFSGFGLDAGSIDVKLHNAMVEERDNAMNTLQDAVAKAEIRALTAEAALATLESELSVVRRQFVQLSSAHEELEGRVDHSAEEAQRRVEELQAACDALAEEKAAAEARVEAVQREVEDQRAAAATVASEREREGEERAELMRRVSFLQEEVAGRDRDVEQLVALLQSREEHGESSAGVIQEQAARLRELSARVHELEEVAATAAAVRGRQEQELSVLVGAVVQKEEEGKKERVLREAAERKCEELGREVERVKMAVQVQEQMYEEQQEKWSREKEDLEEEFRRQFSELEQEYVDKCTALEEQLRDGEEENERVDEAWRTRDEQACALLQSLKDTLQGKEEEIVVLLRDGDAKAAQLAELEQQLGAAAAREREVQARLSRAEEYVAELERELERRGEDVRRAEAEVEEIRRRRSSGGDDQIAELEEVICELEKMVSKEKRAQASLIEDMQAMLRRKEEGVRMHVEDLQRANAVLRENSDKLGAYVGKLQDYSAECERERDEWKGLCEQEQRARADAEAAQRELSRELQELKRWAATNDALIRSAQQHRQACEQAQEAQERMQRRLAEATEEAARAVTAAQEAQRECERATAQSQQMSLEMERLVRGHSHEKKVLLRDMEVLAQVKQLREQERKEYVSERERMSVVVRRLERELQAKTAEIQQLTQSMTQQQHAQAALQGQASDIPRLREEVRVLEARLRVQTQELQAMSQTHQRAVEEHVRERTRLERDVQRCEEEKEREKSMLTSVVRKSESRVREMEEVLAMMKRKMREQEDRIAVHAMVPR